MPDRRPSLALPAAVLALAAAGCGGPVRTEHSFEALGRPVRAELYTVTERGAGQLADELRAALERARLELGDHPDGELARLNAAAPIENYVVSSRDLYGCITLGLDWARASDGAFDPVRGADWRSVRLFKEAHAIRFLYPGLRIELDGMLEGCALDIAVRNFARVGTRAGRVELGGVQYAWMPPPGRESWSVPLRDPARPELVIGTVETLNRAVAVAGSLDPAPAGGDDAAGRDVQAALAVADTAADAQAIAGALRAMDGLRAGALLERARRTEALLLVRREEGLTLLVSGSLRERLQLDEGYRERLGGRVRFILPPLEFP